MIVDQAGEVIVDFLTLSPSLSKIPSASALLDTSNYTFQAISYGKDAAGFNRHAHAYYSSDYSGIIVQTYEPLNVSSYHSSALASALNLTLLPEFPAPLDVRLEKNICQTIYSNISGLDVGQCANHLIIPQYSATYRVLGCFPPSGGIDYYVVSSLSDPLNKVVYSGTLSSTYNKFGLMDGSGFLTFAALNGAQGKQASVAGQFTSGVLLNLANNFSSTGRVSLAWRLDAGDAGSLLLYGGVYHLGLWCLDIKSMLAEGHNPPFAFNPLNNIRKYRLFAKKTFNTDLLYINDGREEAAGFGGFNTLFDNGNPPSPPVDTQWGKYILYQWTIRFL